MPRTHSVNSNQSSITACKNILYRFKRKKWLVLIRPLVAGFDSTADSHGFCLLCDLAKVASHPGCSHSSFESFKF
jgi:hypothetical protein